MNRKYQITTDEVIINHAKNHLDKPVMGYIGSSIETTGIITSINIKERKLVIQDDNGIKCGIPFDSITIEQYE